MATAAVVQARATGHTNQRPGNRRSTVALIVGIAAALVSGLVVATADGGPAPEAESSAAMPP